MVIFGWHVLLDATHWLVAAGHINHVKRIPIFVTSTAMWICTDVLTSISGSHLREAEIIHLIIFWVNLVKSDNSATDQGCRCSGCRGVAQWCSLANCSARTSWWLKPFSPEHPGISFCSVVRSQEKSWPWLCWVWLMGSHLWFKGTQEKRTTCSAHARKEMREGHKLWLFTHRCWRERSAARTNKTTGCMFLLCVWVHSSRSISSQGNGIYFAVLWKFKSELWIVLFMLVRYLLPLLTGSICVSILSVLIPVQSSKSVPVQSHKHAAQKMMAASPLCSRHGKRAEMFVPIEPRPPWQTCL